MKEHQRRHSVLLVDDDPQLLAVTSALLEDDPDVTCAMSSREALELLDARRFDRSTG